MADMLLPNTAPKDTAVQVYDKKWGWVTAVRDSNFGWLSVPGRYAVVPTRWMELPPKPETCNACGQQLPLEQAAEPPRTESAVHGSPS